VERRLLAFLSLSLLILIGSIYLENLIHPPKPKPADQVAQDEKNDKAALKPGEKGDKKPADAKPGEKNLPAEKPADKPNEKPPAAQANQLPPAEEPINIDPQWFTLGSLAPRESGNKYEMLVTLTNVGAAVERIELSNPKFGDLDNRQGYLGRLALEPAAKGTGCLVNAVGEGTPAALAKMKPGDIVTALDGRPITSPRDLVEALNTTKPNDQVEIFILRDGAKQKLSATLGRYPLSVISPEKDTDPLDILPPDGHDPLSLLLTLHQADGDLTDSTRLDDEIAGLHLRTGHWTGTRLDTDTVEFTRKLPRWDLELVKRYKLARLADKPDSSSPPAYHLMLHVEVRNIGKKAHTVAYQLDGPTGLPTEGWWYSSRISRDWSGLALRDVAMKFHGNDGVLANSIKLADQRYKEIEAAQNGKAQPKDEITKTYTFSELAEAPLAYIGVDAQYFASALIPQNQPLRGKKSEAWLSEVRPMIVGEIPKEATVRRKVDVTCRLTSIPESLDPGQKIEHDYQVFVGPKQPVLLDQYGGGPGNDMGWLVYYGWFWWVAGPMVAVLEFFHWIVGNYGLSILMLTVLVRLCMFPLSRKQALSARKMQELQPEMKKINEKYKASAEQRTKAMQELWRKHNYNPMGGCLLVFVQLPIFMGLYRSLMVNVELRQASLLGEAVRWCSNLSAPDMLWDWSNVMPSFLSGETAWLGPYLNILPVLTVGLFVWQQSMFMPPATDDSTALQQKIMKFMTLAMGFLYFKVASGLCLYFIASSLWGIAERKLLPKTLGPAPGAPATAARPAAPASTNGHSGSSKKKQRGRRN
jgi:YidC/Oxa1 family membrane protein insertase